MTNQAPWSLGQGQAALVTGPLSHPLRHHLHLLPLTVHTKAGQRTRVES